ncbi:MAG: leucine-rich repeat protein [Muribaculaceae bacterium]|nr:leucine-rich repeat protein [Muribaculaceae bacterium]
MTSVTFGNSVFSIGSNAFKGCSGITSIDIPNSVASIGEMAFAGCSGLTSVSIPNSVAYIDYNAFEGCSGLTSVSIPNSVTYFGESAFDGCNGVTSVTITGNGTWNKWLIGLEKSQIQMLKVGSEITEVAGFGLKPNVVCSYAKVPPTCTDSSFIAYDAELHVPSAAAGSYCTAPYWQNFSIIKNDLTEKITLSQTEAECKVGDELQLKASAISANKPNELLWSTTDPSVASVDSVGQVTLHKKGECRIFASLASDQAVYASCLVIVCDAESGDVTGDGKVDVEDGNAVVNVILGLVASDELRATSDVTGDGKIDVEDVNIIINKILEL